MRPRPKHQRSGGPNDGVRRARPSGVPGAAYSCAAYSCAAGARFIVLLASCLLAGNAGPVSALVHFDFETPYLVHPGLQVWDFCLVRDAGLYHAFYHTLPPQDLHPANADTIWHAVSPDLLRWNIAGPALTSGPQWWDAVAVWAPDVVFDPASGRWAMLYTGVGDAMVQRACLAWSFDLETWEKSAVNPVFEPDSLVYHWSPTQAWSSFRDPFVFYDGQQWNMLSTAALRLGVYPGYRRGIVHRAVSADLEHWQDAGVFYEHDGVEGRTRDLESVQYLVRDGWHHLFFVEQDLDLEYHPTSHMVAADPLAWTMAERTYAAAGWAPEIERFDDWAGAEVFARLVKDQDPRDGTWFVAAKFDSVRFELGGRSAVVFAGDPLGSDWQVRTGEAGAAAPTFGDNPVLRGDPPAGLQGHAWFGSRENYGGPLSGVGLPGYSLGDSAMGGLESRPFILEGGHFQLLLGGGDHPATCYVALLDDATGGILSRIYPTGQPGMIERIWDVSDHTGRWVRLQIVDAEEGADGWIAVDGVEELEGVVAAGEPGGWIRAPNPVITGLRADPNPLNGGTGLRFDVSRPGSCRVEIFDLRGRRLWRSPEITTDPGAVRVTWDGRGADGDPLPSGTYVCRATHACGAAASTRLTILK